MEVPKSKIESGLQDGLGADLASHLGNGTSVLRAVLREELALGMHELLERLALLLKTPNPGLSNQASGGDGVRRFSKPRIPHIQSVTNEVVCESGPRAPAKAVEGVKTSALQHVSPAGHPFGLVTHENVVAWTPRSVTSDDECGGKTGMIQPGLGAGDWRQDSTELETTRLTESSQAGSPRLGSNTLVAYDSHGSPRSDGVDFFCGVDTSIDKPRESLGQDGGRRASRTLKRKPTSTTSLFRGSGGAREGQEHFIDKLRRFTTSRHYESFSGTLILTNAVYIGWQTQHLAELYRDQASRGEELSDSPLIFLVGHFVFTLLFLVELLPRWMACGLFEFFRNADMTWNILDIVVVLCGIIESVLDVVERSTGVETGGVLKNVSTLRLLRIVRVVRVVRVIRVIKFFRELRMMIHSILGSMKNLLWVIIILGVTFYLFGVTFTLAVIENLKTMEDWNGPQYRTLLESFGTVDRSALSLFMSMSGGNDWTVYYEALLDLPIGYRWGFLAFIIFMLFAIVNIVTGVFVEAAMQSNLKDRDIIAQEELQSKRQYLDSMKEVFEEMDEDGQGTITMNEFEAKLQDDRVIAFFNAMKLDVSDARTLFRLIDVDKSGDITIEEFLKGVYDLQGESRSLDMKIMQLEVTQLRDKFIDFIDAKDMLARLDGSRVSSYHDHSPVEGSRRVTQCAGTLE